MSSPAATLILDPPLPAAWNMAVDEALLDAAGAGSLGVTLRIYGWSKPTLSLGYFQSLGDRDSHSASQQVDVVRRASGGGAILHHHEITYSLIVAPAAGSGAAEQLYRQAHRAWLDALAAIGLVGEFYQDASGCCGTCEDPADPETKAPAKTRARLAEPFLCFQRRSPLDLVARPAEDLLPPRNLGPHGTVKLCGSAQRRRTNAVLQHGSLLLARSEFAPELPGLAEIAGRPVDSTHLIPPFITSLGERLSAKWRTTSLPSPVAAAARRIETAKFGHPVWTARR